LHANDQGRLAEARDLLAQAFVIAEEPVAPGPLILDIIDENSKAGGAG
jgi:hypothetical protein